MDPGHIMICIVVIGIGIVLFIAACVCCLKLCDSLFTCCSYLNGRSRSKRSKRTNNRKQIRYSGFNRLLLQHHSTETQKLAPLYAKPTTIKLTRTDTNNGKQIRYSGFNRLLLQHHSTETQKLAPIYAKPTTIELTRTESTCVICLEPKVEADISALRCAHTFHGPCIRKSLKNKQECPVCRTPLYTSCKENVV
ncbi:E3 ubiquitin-protein ligase RNF4-like isoform X2 [Mytilus edulis]|uniref:E3 ubiquitin-protein ligase RNF4-like isoform X2 n=1 Tax=Mytilus edulis TaxID=6550 RepID=UPI0039F11740